MCKNAKEAVSAVLTAQGLSRFGFCPFSRVAEHLVPGYSTKKLPERPKTIISFAFPYRIPENGPRNVARFAALPDYHTVIGALLSAAAEALTQRFPGHAFVPFVDESPIPEVVTAAAAGLGVVGRHNLLITKEFGSWVFIGELVTDLALPIEAQPVPYCPDCGACAARCPAGALDKKPFDRTRCLSSVTQQKAAPSSEMARLMRQEGIAWGCDRCQEACPLNEGTSLSGIAAFYGDVHPLVTADNYDTLQNRVFFYRKKDVFLRNLRIIAGTEENTR